MGTRSHTVIKMDCTKEVNPGDVTMYRQFDGYPEGHGLDLANYLKDIRIVDGISPKDEKDKIANGMRCLAAQLIAHFKNGPGDIYLSNNEQAPGWQEYTYVIYKDKGSGQIKMLVDGISNDNEDESLFDGTPQEFINRFGKEQNNG
jgi:hypothetical protein